MTFSPRYDLPKNAPKEPEDIDPSDYEDEDEPVYHPEFGFKRKEQNPAARYY